MNRRNFLFRCLAGGGLLWLGSRWIGSDFLRRNFGGETVASSKASGYYRIVVMGDPHLPVRDREVKDAAKRQRIIEAKERVIEDINGWQDVGEVAVLGDIAAQFGIDPEYEYAKAYLGRLQKPVYLVTGNHDYIYQDVFSADGKFIWGDAASRQRKLNRFQAAFGLKSLFYSHKAGNFQLIYLSPDSLEARHLTELSRTQLDWFQAELQKNAEAPVIVFFHAPLQDTLLSYNKTVNTPNFVAQPADRLHTLIRENRRITLWVSGHTHTPATNESYAAEKVNTYDGHVHNIHTPDMDRETIWTNSLYLYSDKVVVRTFNHTSKQWEDRLDRTISLG